MWQQKDAEMSLKYQKYNIFTAEGEGCSIGDPSNAKHTSLCGPGLTCVVPTEAQTDGTCQKSKNVLF